METLSLENVQFMMVQIFNLATHDFEIIVPTKMSEELNTFVVKLAMNEAVCPYCGSTHVVIKDYNKRKITHQMLAGKNTHLIYLSRRLACKHCGKTFMETNPFSHDKSRISIKTIDLVMKDLENPNETFSTVARRYSISTTTVMNIFDKHYTTPKVVLPKRLCIDENYAFKSTEENSKYVCVLLDFDTRRILDILPSRKLDYLRDYLQSFKKEERDKVELVCSDMWDSYRTITHDYFPQAKHVIDLFHLKKEFYSKLDQIRIKVMKEFKKNDEDSDEYYLLKNFNWMLWGDDQRFYNSSGKRKYNRKLKQYLSLLDIYELLLDTHPLLTEGVALKDELKDFFENNSIETASKAFTKLVNSFANSSDESFTSFAGTLVKWKWSIINYFINIGDKDKNEVRHISNGLIENRNKIIKEIKYSANGYKNFERFRARILYSINKEYDRYLINPDSIMVNYKRAKGQENYKRHMRGESRKYNKRK